MTKLGFTFYPQDWWTSDTFFEFDAFERYIYLECLFLMYRNDGYMKTQKTQFENRIGIKVDDSVWEKITQKFEKNNLGYTSYTVNARLRKAAVSRKNGKNGGRPRKDQNPENPENNLKEKENINKREIEDIGDKTQKHFILINSKYLHDKKYRLYGVDGVTEFLEMNGSKWPRVDFAEKFIKDKDGQMFNDYDHILKSYNKYIENQFK